METVNLFQYKTQGRILARVGIPGVVNPIDHQLTDGQFILLVLVRPVDAPGLYVDREVARDGFVERKNKVAVGLLPTQHLFGIRTKRPVTVAHPLKV